MRGGYGIFYQQINGETTHAAEAPWRGTTQLRQGRIEDPFGSLGQTEPPPESPAGSVFDDLGVSRPELFALSGADPDRLHGSGSQDELHAAFQRVAAAATDAKFVVEGAYIGKIGSKLVGHNYFNAAPFIASPVTGQPPSLQNVEQRAPFSPGVISAQSRVLGNFFRSEYHSLQLRVERRFVRTFSISGSYALSKNLTNQPENTTGLISNIPNPFDLESLWGPSFLDRRHVVAASWVWSPQFTIANPVSARWRNGWTITGFTRIQSGSPLVFTMGTDVAQNGMLQPNGPIRCCWCPGRRPMTLRRNHSSTADMPAVDFNTAAFVPLRSDVPRGITATRGGASSMVPAT